MEQQNQPNDYDPENDYYNDDVFGWRGGRRLSDEAIAEIKGWKNSRKSTEHDEEIWRVLQNDVNYYSDQLGDIAERLSLEDEDEYEVRNGKIVIPDEVKKLLKERDELKLAYDLAKIKVAAYENGVMLSDEDTKKILQRGGLRIINDREKIYDAISTTIEEDNLLKEKPNTTTIKKFKIHLNKNKKKWKAALLPYITPMAQAQTAPTAGRQRSAPKKPARRATRSSAKSGDSNSDPDPEPEPPRQLYYTYQSFAQLVDCTTRTLYNKVSTGQFPRPIKTAFGPRFTQEHLNSVIKTQPASARGRGRPRIAQTLGKGGVQ